MSRPFTERVVNRVFKNHPARERSARAQRQLTLGSADRGQAHTLEAIIAAVVLLASVTFALEAVAVTPESASASNKFVETQQEQLAVSLLATAATEDLLSSTLRYWDTNAGTFHNVGVSGAYVDGGPPTEFGARLNETFFTASHAVNVNVYYVDVDGTRHVEQLVHSGEASDHAVRATRTVTLYDSDSILAADGTATNETLTSSNSYFAPDASPDSHVYNVVVVEVVVWRM